MSHEAAPKSLAWTVRPPHAAVKATMGASAPVKAAHVRASVGASVVSTPLPVTVAYDRWCDYLPNAVALVTLALVTLQVVLALQRPNLRPRGSRTVDERDPRRVDLMVYVHNDGASPARNYLMELLLPCDELDPHWHPIKAEGDPDVRRVRGVLYHVRSGQAKPEGAWLFPNDVPQKARPAGPSPQAERRRDDMPAAPVRRV